MRDISGGDTERGEPCQVDLTAYLALHPADALKPPDAWHTEDSLSDSVIQEPRQSLLIHARRGNRIHEDRLGGGCDRGDSRLLQVRRQIGADPIYCVLGLDEGV